MVNHIDIVVSAAASGRQIHWVMQRQVPNWEGHPILLRFDIQLVMACWTQVATPTELDQVRHERD